MPPMDFQNNFKQYNFKIMKIKKSLIILTIFISCSLIAQEENLINTFTNNASIGINVGVISNLSNNTDKITYVNYTKHINNIIALQFGGTSIAGQWFTSNSLNADLCHPV